MNNNCAEPSFHLRFLGEQVLHSSYSSASYGWLAHKLAAFSEADNAVIVKIEDEGLVLRKLDTSNVITRLPFISNCQCFIHNRDLGLFSVVGSDVGSSDNHRLLVFRAASIDTIKDFSSCLRKAVLSSAFRRTNATKSIQSASHMSNFFEVFYLGRARFSHQTKPMTPEFVDKAVAKLSQDISCLRALATSKTFPTERAQSTEAEVVDRSSCSSRQRPRSHTIANTPVEFKDLLSAKCLSPKNPNRTLLIQLTESELFLISPSSKAILLRVSFSEITAGCQGLDNAQCFAFLTSVSESLSTTEAASNGNGSSLSKQKVPVNSADNAVKCKNDINSSSNNNSQAPPFSPASQQSSVNTMWAYIFLCADEATSSNAVLSLRSCIRGPFGAAATNSNGFVSSLTSVRPITTKDEPYSADVGGPQQPRRDSTNAAALMCDACPVRDFNALCSSLIDLASDEERLKFLSDYVNSPETSPLTNDDVAWIRQLLPKSAPTEIALVCDVVFALFQLTEFHRNTHVHVFESTNDKLKNAAAAVEALQKQKRFGARAMISSGSFSAASGIDSSLPASTSFVDLIRDKMSLKSKRRGSLIGSLFQSTEQQNKDEHNFDAPTAPGSTMTTTTTSNERLRIDLRQLVRKPSGVPTDGGSGMVSGDIFREYVIVSDAEVARMSSGSTPSGQLVQPSQSIPSSLADTPKSAKLVHFAGGGKAAMAPGSEPPVRNSIYARRCTVDASATSTTFLRPTSKFQTPLARFEQFPSTAPGYAAQHSARRHSRLASIAGFAPLPSTPVSISVSDVAASARRRSIFEMVVCPSAGSSCTNIDTVAKSITVGNSQKPVAFQATTNATPERVKSPDDLFPSLIDPDQLSKQLDYEEPLGGCGDDVAREWLQVIADTPTDFASETERVERLVAAGIPKHLRGRVWSWLIKRELMLSRRSDSVPKISQAEYTELLTGLTPCNQQILMDLGRTFPSHVYFAQHFGAGQLALFNILKAYSLVDSEVGYCQGISFVAGVLLMHSASEYDAFSLLLSLMFGFGLRTVYLPNMEGLHRCLYQLTRLLDSLLPASFEHLTANDVMPVFFASPWFVTLFSSQFPLGFVVRVFDLVFYGNIEMLFRIIFSLFSINEPLLLSRTGGFEDVVDFLKTTFTEMSIIQLERLVVKVFSLDFSVELHRFAVEYDIYREEHDVSPARIIEDVALNQVGTNAFNSTASGLTTNGLTMNNGSAESQKENNAATSTQCAECEPLRELALARHKVVELRAERAELLKTIDEMQAKIVHHESEVMRLESLNETLRTENAILRAENAAAGADVRQIK